MHRVVADTMPREMPPLPVLGVSSAPLSPPIRIRLPLWATVSAAHLLSGYLVTPPPHSFGACVEQGEAGSDKWLGALVDVKVMAKALAEGRRMPDELMCAAFALEQGKLTDLMR